MSDLMNKLCNLLKMRISESGKAASDMTRDTGSTPLKGAAHTFEAEDGNIENTFDRAVRENPISGLSRTPAPAPGSEDTTPDKTINKKLREMAEENGIVDLRRFPVPPNKTSFGVDFPEYDPPFVDIPRGRTRHRKEDDYPDPDDPREIETFFSHEVAEVRREGGYPMNPRGRTGLRGRGMLNKWGATQAADPIITRYNERGELEILLIKRKDTGEWALPGGKIDPGEQPWQAANRELGEEAGVEGIQIDSSRVRQVYQGYVDDTRNTDNAWMETTAFHYHLNPSEAANVRVLAGSDAEKVQWTKVDDELYSNMFASQGEYMRVAIEGLH
ncbi:NUDIX domain-containing protein [Nocardia sp. NPDC049190]|uniref:NUDIX domain-containing protein n=1 Tax=Nocardia sp. NPDC049190 TaxID=3155650 RepID=UPI00340F31DE